MDLNTMMANALARRGAIQAEVGRLDKERRAEALAHWASHVSEIFGTDLPSELGMTFDGTDYSKVARFAHQGKQYSLSEGRSSWYLVRKDPRDDDDDREQPSAECYAHYHNGQDNNRDELLCALSDLAGKPEIPARPTHRGAPSEPTTEERLLDALRGLIRNELSDWQGYQH